jgi:putative NADH-flavin reductase
MRIAVFGASSGIGRELVLQARTAGHHAVAVARSIRSEPAASLTPVKGSVLDPGVADRAVVGADAVAWCVGVNTLGPAFLRTVTVFSAGTRRVIEVMKNAGVSRLVVITGIGAGESRGHGGLLYEWIGLPLILGAIYADKDRQEAIVKASGLNWTIVRPTLLTNRPRTGRYRILTKLEGVHGGQISRADCADCMLRALVDGAWSRATITITDSLSSKSASDRREASHISPGRAPGGLRGTLIQRRNFPREQGRVPIFLRQVDGRLFGGVAPWGSWLKENLGFVAADREEKALWRVAHLDKAIARQALRTDPVKVADFVEGEFARGIIVREFNTVAITCAMWSNAQSK